MADEDGTITAERPQLIGALSAKVLDADGTVLRDLGVISSGEVIVKKPRRRKAWFAKLLGIVAAIIISGLLFVLLKLVAHLLALIIIFGIVTNAGVAFEAATFAGGTSTSAFNFHDSGTGTNAAAVTDTALQTPTGIARATGVQTTPGSTNVYQTVATITYNNTFAITEWGLFSLAAAGTLWDRRVFSAINVVSTNAVQYTYQLTLPSGGT